ncbi:MAG TPA: cbb3-type cytochrome c oxidase subunit I [Solirubrobacteraceae bacterium]|jgi:cytochrome c oxidase subunit 1|nr:cbb3-type cytochrome c oxidase subunit I [Solirubrobacteraceae bacterium]
MSTTISSHSQPTPVRRPLWRRLVGFNLLSAVLLGVAGYYLGWFIGHRVSTSKSFEFISATDENDVALLLAYLFGVAGFLIGLGFANYPVSRLLGKPASLREKEDEGIGRYFGLCTDHKVVGIQYLVGIGLFFFIAGLNAMLIRTELLHDTPTTIAPNQYLSLVGMHGAMMMGMMTSGVLGPFANYFVPIMIGARRMAFPRIEALTFWLLMAAGFILTSSIFFGGFPTGWTGYEPLNDQAVMGMDSYIIFFALVGVSMCLLGLNMIATIITMRAPGLTWSRLPIFVWSVLATSVLMVLSAPMLIATLAMAALDRTINTGFFVAGAGGSPYLFENLFWFFGHPEVYILALPGFGIVLELLPVFTRKPLWGYRLAVSGMLGVALLSFFVWQHHLFVSGINADLRPFYMLSTEIISVPTGFIFLCVMGTLWKARSSFTVPMLFCLGWTFNFLIGGLSGVFLSDTPSDTDTHGSFFVMAHFHYTIMGGLIFTFFAAIYYWVPKMTGLRFNERLAKWHFWLMFVAFNSTFMPLFVLGMKGMPRRVSSYAPNLHGLNVWVSISAFVLGFSMLIFLCNVVYSLIVARLPAEANPWRSKSLEWQVPTPVPVNNFEQIPVIDSDPYDYGTPLKISGAGASPAPAGT